MDRSSIKSFERGFKVMFVVAAVGAGAIIGTVVYVGMAVARYLGSH